MIFTFFISIGVGYQHLFVILVVILWKLIWTSSFWNRVDRWQKGN